MATVIDELVILLNLRTNGAEQQLNAVDESVQDLREHSEGLDGVFKNLGKSLGSMAGGFTLMIAAVAAAKAAFDLFKDTIDETADTSRLAEKLNMEETALRQWKMAAEDAKVSGDDLLSTLGQMTADSAGFRRRGFKRSELNNDEAISYFTEAHGNLQRVNQGNALETLMEYANVTKTLHDKEKQGGQAGADIDFANSIGKGNLYNLLVLGEEGIRASLEANRKNAELSKESGDKAKSLQKGIIDLGQEVNKLKLTISEELVPPLTSFVKFLNQVMGNTNDSAQDLADGAQLNPDAEFHKNNPIKWMSDANHQTTGGKLLEKAGDKYGFNPVELKQAWADASQHYGVPLDLLMHQALQESGDFNPKARSRAGAVGIGQQTPIAIEELNKRMDKEDRLREVIGKRQATMTDALDPVKSAWMQASIMSQNLKRHHGDEALALAEYNAGIARVGGYRKKGGELVPERFPDIKETKDYVRKIQQTLGRPLVTGAKYRDLVNGTMTKPMNSPHKEGVQIHINKMDVNAKDATGANKFADQILKNPTFTQMQTAVTQ